MADATISTSIPRLVRNSPSPDTLKSTTFWPSIFGNTWASKTEEGQHQKIEVGKYAKLVELILLGRSDANIDFDDLRHLLLRMGFDERTRGSHHLFRKEGVAERLNLQRDGAKAKPYQVKQVRSLILRYGLQDVEDA